MITTMSKSHSAKIHRNATQLHMQRTIPISKIVSSSNGATRAD